MKSYANDSCRDLMSGRSAQVMTAMVGPKRLEGLIYLLTFMCYFRSLNETENAQFILMQFTQGK